MAAAAASTKPVANVTGAAKTPATREGARNDRPRPHCPDRCDRARGARRRLDARRLARAQAGRRTEHPGARPPKTQLSSAEGQLADARAAQAQYASAYASIVSLGKAVPASQEVPSLIYQLAQAASSRKVELHLDQSGSANGYLVFVARRRPRRARRRRPSRRCPSRSSSTAASSQLEHLFAQLNRFTSRTSTGALEVSGRLLTIQSVKLASASEGAGTGGWRRSCRARSPRPPTCSPAARA